MFWLLLLLGACIDGMLLTSVDHLQGNDKSSSTICRAESILYKEMIFKSSSTICRAGSSAGACGALSALDRGSPQNRAPILLPLLL